MEKFKSFKNGYKILFTTRKNTKYFQYFDPEIPVMSHVTKFQIQFSGLFRALN